MDEKEIQATMERLVDQWMMKQSNGGATLEALKLASDVLVKFTRLVEAVECIASCQIDVADAIEGAGASLEAARPEGNC
jgi:hypothetical protein